MTERNGQTTRAGRFHSPATAFGASVKSWLGTLPPHWSIHKLKFAVDIRLSGVDKKTEEGESPVRLCNYIDVYYNDRISGTITFMEATASHIEIERFQIAVGDVLITKDSESTNDIAVPALVTDELPGVICAYHLAMLRPFRGVLTGPFLYYLLKARAIAAQLEASAQGVTRFALGYDEIGRTRIPLPPIAEQVAITHYLDHHCATIAGTAAMLGAADPPSHGLALSLREYRTAVITAAVTGQIDVPGKG